MPIHDLYRSPSRLPGRRALLPNLNPDDIVSLGWAEYLQGYSARASSTMGEATRRVPDRPYLALNAYLLDDLVRGRRGRPQALCGFARRALAAGDHDAWLLASAHALAEARRHGRPGPKIKRAWDRLAKLAHDVGARLAPEMELRAARAALALGQLEEACTRARQLARAGARGCEVGTRARLVTQVAEARRSGARPVLPRGLESLHTFHRLEALFTLADQARRGGDPEAAADYLARANRLASSRRLTDACTSVARARAALALDAGRLVEAATRIEEAAGEASAPGRAHLRLLQARLLVDRGEPTLATGLIFECRDAIARQGWCDALQELSLLEARLDLDPKRVLRHWRRARRWEDSEARLAMLVLLLPRVKDRGTFRRLWRDRPLDPRLHHVRERIRGHFDGPVPRDVRGHLIRRTPPPAPPAQAWDLTLDLERRRASVGSRTLDLRRSGRTLRFLQALVEYPDGLTVCELTDLVWERDRIPYETDQLVHSAVYRLRGRLPDPDLIEFTAERYRLRPGTRARLVGADPASSPPARAPK